MWHKKWYFFNGLPIRELDSESSFLIGQVGRSKCTNFSWAPNLNTQSCIKGLLVVQDFCFWAIWAAGPVHWGRLWLTLEGGFFHVFGVKMFFFFLNSITSPLKSCLINIFFLIKKKKRKKPVFLGLRTFSNVNVLQKGLLLQDWVFRME